MPDPAPGAGSRSGGSDSGLRRLWKALLARPDGGQVVVAVLLGALGFGVVTQVRVDDEDRLEGARRTDLVQILSDLNQRSARLEDEIAELETTRRELSADDDQAVLERTVERSRQLAILAGTSQATGPGVVVTIADPGGQVRARHLITAISELRAAGAEAIQIEGGNGVAVRVVMGTYFLDGADGELRVDGVRLTRPYVITAIGEDPGALRGSVEFVGGTSQIVEEAVVEEYDEVTVDALREAAEPQYARPAPGNE